MHFWCVPPMCSAAVVASAGLGPSRHLLLHGNLHDKEKAMMSQSPDGARPTELGKEVFECWVSHRRLLLFSAILRETLHLIFALRRTSDHPTLVQNQLPIGHATFASSCNAHSSPV